MVHMHCTLHALYFVILIVCKFNRCVVAADKHDITSGVDMCGVLARDAPAAAA